MIKKPKLHTCLSPALLPLYEFRKDTIVVVIDIFRATSTICTALANGAKEVIPVETVLDCMSLKNTREDLITAGERDGKVIEGLQRGNSPVEYTPEVIENKTLALTTTNGTRLLHLVKDAGQVVIGSFLNLDALCDHLKNSGKNVLLACAGWRNKVNIEDSLFAGAVIGRTLGHFDLEYDSSLVALEIYRQAQNYGSPIAFLRSGTHYKRLIGFGMEQDVIYCCQLNIHPVIPVFKDPFLILL